MGLTREEVSARQSLGAHIGRIRRVARECGIDPDEIMFKNPDGSWQAGRMLLENELPPLPPERKETEWQELIRGYTKQEGLTEEEVVRRTRAAIDRRTGEDVEEILT